MADNISRVNGVDEMMYVGELPWHKKGQGVQTAKTSDEAMQLAHMDWEVRGEPMYVKLEELGNDIWTSVPNRMAIVRCDNNEILGTVGDRYQIFQNREQFEFFDQFVGDKYAMYHTAGVLGKGERTWILAKLPDSILVAPDDVVDKYILLMSSHDGSYKLTMIATPVRVVCQNTLNMALNADHKREFRIRHSGDLMGKVADARDAFGLTLDYYKVIGDNFKQMTKMKVMPQYAESIVSSVFPLLPDADDSTATRVNRVRSKVLDLFDNGKGNNNPSVRHTRWTLYNAFTEYADYGLDYRDTGKTDVDSKRLDSIWFGRSRSIKQKAFDLLTIW